MIWPLLPNKGKCDLKHYSGWGVEGVAPYRFLLCCAEMACSSLMKLSDFYYNYIEHHLKWFPVDSNQWHCHDNAFVKERLAKIFRFSKVLNHTRNHFV